MSADQKSLPPPDLSAPASNATEQFLEKNFKKLAIIAGLIVLLFVALGLARYFKHETEREAAESFTAAKSLADCDLVISKYSGTRAAGNARLLKSELLWSEDKKDESVKVLQEFLTSDSSHPLFSQALLALGTKQLALGQKDSGRKTLEEVIQKHGKSDEAAAAQLYLGDLFWTDGKIEEARKVFIDMPRNYPGNAILSRVEERIKLIDAGIPTVEVEAPPAPKPPAPVPGAPPIGPLSPTAPTPGVTAPPALTAPSLTAPAPPAPPLAPTLPTPTLPVTSSSPVPAPAPVPAPIPVPAPTPVPAPAPESKPAPAPAPATPSPAPAPAAPAPAAPASATPAAPAPAVPAPELPKP